MEFQPMRGVRVRAGLGLTTIAQEELRNLDKPITSYATLDDGHVTAPHRLAPLTHRQTRSS